MTQHLKSIITLTGLILLVGWPPEILAQDARELRLQETYRVRSLDSVSDNPKTRVTEGKLVVQNETAITLQTSYSGQTEDVLWEEIQGLEIRTQKSRRGSAAGIGLAVGAAAGALVGFASGDDPPGIVSFSAGAKAGMAALVLAPIGALIGAASAPGEKWEPAPTSLLNVGLTVGAHEERGIVFSARF